MTEVPRVASLRFCPAAPPDPSRHPADEVLHVFTRREPGVWVCALCGYEAPPAVAESRERRVEAGTVDPETGAATKPHLFVRPSEGEPWRCATCGVEAPAWIVERRRERLHADASDPTRDQVLDPTTGRMVSRRELYGE